MSVRSTNLNTTTSFVDPIDNTKKLAFQTASSNANTNLTVVTNQTSNAILSLPNMTGTDIALTSNTTQTINGSKNFKTITATNLLNVLTPVTTSANIYALTSLSSRQIYFTGIINQIVSLPSSGITIGYSFTLFNATTNCSVTIRVGNPAVTLCSINANQKCEITLGTGNGSLVTNWIYNITNNNSISALNVGGSTSQVQYNNGGILNGTSGLIIDSDSMPIINNQVQNTIIPSNGSKIFAILKAGRTMLAQMNSLGDIYEFQPFEGSKKISKWDAVGDTSVTLSGFGNKLINPESDDVIASTFAITNLFQSMRRITYKTNNTLLGIAGTTHGIQQFWRGNGLGLGGFYYVVRCGLSLSRNKLKFFCGFYSGSSGFPSNIEPSSQINMFGFGYDSNDTNMSFMHNANSITSKDSLTGVFPIRDNSITMYEFRIYAAPNGSTIFYSIEVLGGGSLYNGSTNVNIPASTQLLCPQIWISNGIGAISSIDIVSQYLETNY